MARRRRPGGRARRSQPRDSRGRFARGAVGGALVGGALSSKAARRRVIPGSRRVKVTRSGGYAGVSYRVAGRRVDVAARVKVTRLAR